MKSCYEKYLDREFPEEFQKKIEGFASMGNDEAEELFRAGWYIGIHNDYVREDLKGGVK